MKKIIIALMVLAGLGCFLAWQSGSETIIVRAELEEAVLAELKKLAYRQDELAEKVQKLENAAKVNSQQVEDLRKRFETAQSEHKQARKTAEQQAQKLLSEIREELTRYEKLVQKLSDNQSKSDSYLTAARDARAKGEKTADVLYASALRYAPEKMPILKDYVAWRQEEISSELSKGTMQSLGSARERLSLLKVFCDTVLEDASPQDIRSVKELLDMLAQSDRALAAAEKTLEDNQRNELEQVAGVLSTAARQQLDDYAGKWGDGSVVPALEELRDEVFSSIQQWRSCCTSTEESLMLPELAGITDEILEKWLTNFKVRMETADIDWEKRQEDWDAAEEVLELAAEKKEGNIKTLFDELKAIERQEMSRQWIKLAETAVDEYAIDELLSRVNDLDRGLIKDAHRALLCKAYDKRISRYETERQNIMNKISDAETRTSFLSGITTQCWQLELEILDAQEKYELDEFKEQLDKVRQLRKEEQVQNSAPGSEAQPEPSTHHVADKKTYYEQRWNELNKRLYTGVSERKLTQEVLMEIKGFAENELKSEISNCSDNILRGQLTTLQNQARKAYQEWWNNVF
ncbi:MAG: hypothetical protein J6R92_03140 [Akkermansia sp.]|nr:hypothetical protein [Akkermansia sp.]